MDRVEFWVVAQWTWLLVPEEGSRGSKGADRLLFHNNSEYILWYHTIDSKVNLRATL